MPTDSPQLQKVLTDCFPSLVIERPLAASGQRVVYLAHFDDSKIPLDLLEPAEVDPDDPEASPFLHGWGAWGKIVLKVVSGAGADTIARLEAEVDILAAVRPENFPKLLYANHFAEARPLTSVLRSPCTSRSRSSSKGTRCMTSVVISWATRSGLLNWPWGLRMP